MARARIFFNDINTVPASIAYDLGQSFEVEDIDDFIYTYSDVLEGATKEENAQATGGIIYFVTGVDIEGYYTFGIITYGLIIPTDGGDGGVAP